MANEIYDSSWWGNTIDTASSIGTSTEMIQGQFNLTKIGEEEVTNGDFATDSNWNKTQATISNGFANINSDGSYAAIDQINVSVIGKTYLYSIDVKSITGTMQFRLGSGTDVDITTTGVKTGYIVATSTTLEVKRKAGAGAINVTIDNVSLKEVRASSVEAVKCLADAIHRIGIQNIQN
jgi:hypothetical protein